MSHIRNRRALLCGLATLPALTVPAMAASNPDAAFLALAPRLLPMLDRYDELWADSCPTYEPGIAEVRKLVHGGLSWTEAEAASPLYQVYVAARAPADELDNIIDEMVCPFMDVPVTTLRGLLLKTRIGLSLKHYEDDAADDLRKLIDTGALCV